MTGSEWTVGCEGGSVSISRSTVTTIIDGKEEKKEIQNERSGIPSEVRKWGEAITARKQIGKQTPEEVLANLEIVRYVNF